LNKLLLYQKIYDLLLYLYPVTAKMPKYEKFTLQAQIKNCAIEMARCVIRANKSTAKKTHLYSADVLLQELKMLVRLAHDLRYIPPRTYETICGRLSEIGALLGGMIRYVQQGHDKG
jgi:four helix bundle protein